MATATASLECVCPRCGTVYPIDRDQILTGVWRLACPTSHPKPPDPAPAVENAGVAA